jgi:hypothetical protein
VHHAGQIEAAPRRSLLVHEINLVLADLLQAEFLRHFAEVLAELVDVPGVGVDGAGRKVADLHVFSHAVDERIASAFKRRHRTGLLS